MTKTPKTTTSDLPIQQQLRDLLVKTLDEDKAEEITVIDLEGKAAYADYMIVATGLNSRHLQSLADSCNEKVIELGYPKSRMEGLNDANWVILDAHDIIVHLFRPAVRQFYKLEDLWTMEPAAREQSVPDQ